MLFLDRRRVCPAPQAAERPHGLEPGSEGHEMRYGSVCSGIEAASIAWRPLGWHCAFVSEIKRFPSAVLAERFPDVPNLGDFTKIRPEDYEGDIDLLVGGTPCQAFSIAAPGPQEWSVIMLLASSLSARSEQDSMRQGSSSSYVDFKLV